MLERSPRARVALGASVCGALVVGVTLAACVVEVFPAPPRPLLRDLARPAPSASDAALPRDAAGSPGDASAAEASDGAADAALDAAAGAFATPESPAPPSEAQLTCQADSDCVATLPNGCCHDGRSIALAKGSVDAYHAAFTCPTPRPMCPMHLVLDTRVAACDGKAHRCVLVDAPSPPATKAAPSP